MKVIKNLALRSNPTNTVALRLDEEIRGIKDDLERSQYRDRFEFNQVTDILKSGIDNEMALARPVVQMADLLAKV